MRTCVSLQAGMEVSVPQIKRRPLGGGVLQPAAAACLAWPFRYTARTCYALWVLHAAPHPAGARCGLELLQQQQKVDGGFGGGARRRGCCTAAPGCCCRGGHCCCGVPLECGRCGGQMKKGGRCWMAVGATAAASAAVTKCCKRAAGAGGEHHQLHG